MSAYPEIQGVKGGEVAGLALDICHPNPQDLRCRELTTLYHNSVCSVRC